MTARHQQNLFGDPEPEKKPRRRRSAPIEPAEVAPELEAVAAELPADLRLGTSSWSFPGWAGIVFADEAPEPRLSREGLSAYGRHPLLRTVGLDRTHYAPMTAEQLGAHAEQVPEDFRFLVKAHEVCTLSRFPDHPRYGARKGEKNELFLDPSYAIDQVVAPVLEGLGERAGPILFQVAPQSLKPLGGPEAFTDRMCAFLDALPRGPLYAVEIRNQEILTDEYARALHSVNGLHCINVHPRMPDPLAQWQTADAATGRALVVRWMLHGDQSYENALARYRPFTRLVDEDIETRDSLSQMVAAALEIGQPVFVIINNKAEGSAPLSVFRLAERIHEELENPPG